MITLESFKKLYELLDGEPEFGIAIEGMPDEYMIIKYSDGPGFQRCGADADLPIQKYDSLDELLASSDVDGICLSEEWDKVPDVILNGSLSVTDDIEDICDLFGLRFEESSLEFKKR